MNRRHRADARLRRRVALFVLAIVLIFTAAMEWLSALTRSGDDLLRVGQYLALFVIALAVLVGMVREVVAAHTAYITDLAERRFFLEDGEWDIRSNAEGDDA